MLSEYKRWVAFFYLIDIISLFLGYVGHMDYLRRNGCIGIHLSFQSMGTSCFVTISGKSFSCNFTISGDKLYNTNGTTKNAGSVCSSQDSSCLFLSIIVISSESIFKLPICPYNCVFSIIIWEFHI